MSHPVPPFPNNINTLTILKFTSPALFSLMNSRVLYLIVYSIALSTWLSNKHLTYNIPQINPFIQNLSQSTSPRIFPILANGNSILACAQAKNLLNKPWLQFRSSCSSFVSSFSFPPLLIPTNIQPINKFYGVYLQNISRMWPLLNISTATVLIRATITSYLDC